MTTDEAIRCLTNPVYQSLTTRHSGFAERDGAMLRYRPQVLPFGAVEKAGTELRAEMVLAAGDIFFVDVLPKVVGEGFTTTVFPVPQMLYTGELHAPERMRNEVDLTVADKQAMVDLTNVAFPAFFRPESALLGRYIGLTEGNHLIAMAGERFRVPGLREISTVCTRPGYTGKGYARHLMERLMSAPEGEQPFLHVAGDNTRAISLYERMGFMHLRTLEVIKVAAAF